MSNHCLVLPEVRQRVRRADNGRAARRALSVNRYHLGLSAKVLDRVTEQRGGHVALRYEQPRLPEGSWRIGLIASGTGLVIGTVRLVDCRPTNPADLRRTTALPRPAGPAKRSSKPWTF